MGRPKGSQNKPTEARFWEKVDIQGEDDCWVWLACRNSRGYGRISEGGAGGFIWQAHRFSWVLHFGNIPEGLVVRHRCDNPPCVNPSHLELGTQAENLQDMYARGRAPSNAGREYEYCKKGIHKLAETRRNRRCSECRKKAQRDWYARKNLRG